MYCKDLSSIAINTILLGYYENTFVNPWFVNAFVVRDILHWHTLILMILKTSKTVKMLLGDNHAPYWQGVSKIQQHS